jgi:hypothetical protein
MSSNQLPPEVLAEMEDLEKQAGKQHITNGAAKRAVESRETIGYGGPTFKAHLDNPGYMLERFEGVMNESLKTIKPYKIVCNEMEYLKVKPFAKKIFDVYFSESIGTLGNIPDEDKAVIGAIYQLPSVSQDDQFKLNDKGKPELNENIITAIKEAVKVAKTELPHAIDFVNDMEHRKIAEWFNGLPGVVNELRANVTANKAIIDSEEANLGKGWYADRKINSIIKEKKKIIERDKKAVAGGAKLYDEHLVPIMRMAWEAFPTEVYENYILATYGQRMIKSKGGLLQKFSKQIVETIEKAGGNVNDAQIQIEYEPKNIVEVDGQNYKYGVGGIDIKVTGTKAVDFDRITLIDFFDAVEIIKIYDKLGLFEK